MRCPNCDAPMDVENGFNFCATCYLIEHTVPFDCEYHDPHTFAGPTDGAFILPRTMWDRNPLEVAKFAG